MNTKNIKGLVSVAFGVGSIDSNPDLYDMMRYCREKSVIPNITINGDRMKDSDYENLANLSGAVSVSYYGDDNICFNAIKRLKETAKNNANSTLKQCNIHMTYFDGKKEEIYHLFHSYLNKVDGIKDADAIVLLALKQKGRGTKFSPMPYEDFKELVIYALNNNIPLGFDSCSAHRFIEVAKDIGRYDEFKDFVEPCEGCGCMSSYISVDGKYYPCSFAEDVTQGIDVLKCNDFINDAWNNDITLIEKNKLLDNDRHCPYFEI